MKRPDYFGNLPCPPDKKVPKLIKWPQDHKIHIFSTEVPEMSNLCTFAFSTDMINGGILELGPGSNWYFVDEHLGDEIYYIISGNLTEIECVSGDCVAANPGDTLYIPMGCKHKGYNFSEEKMRCLYVIAPEMWPPETDTTFKQEDIRMYKQGEDKYNLQGEDESKAGLRKKFKVFQDDVNQLGKFPMVGEEARKQPIYYYIMNESNCITTVFGLKHTMRMRFYVSNDHFHVGDFYLPSGGVGSRVSEVDEHGGDMVLYIVKGPIIIFFPDREASFYAEEGDIMYIPPKEKHQFVNYNEYGVLGYFTISKEI